MLVALLLPVLLVISFMAINIAFMHLSRTELRIATDAASRAGGRILALTGDKAEVRT
jgi:Flp pilus assembly protein TadG